jgi:uncharacterized protein Yka (UPF0111/DUF47 family)
LLHPFWHTGFVRHGELLLTAFSETVKIGVDAIKESAAWLGKQAKELEEQILKLANEIQQAAANIAAHLIGYMALSP